MGKLCVNGFGGKALARKPNTPYKLSTGSRIRNIILTILVFLLIAAGVGYGVYKAFGKDLFPKQETVVDAPKIVAPAEKKPEAENLFTPQKAEETLVTYYNALASSDSEALRSIGADSAAAAVDNGWLAAMEYAVDTSKTSTPVATEMPASIGIWAGNNLYNIIDFYDGTKTDASVRNNITGLSNLVGWIYFDSTQGRWAIVDPTIPIETNAPEIPNLVKYSQDRLIDIKMSSVGSLSNPWWSYAQLNYDITSSDETSPVTIAEREFDNGITTLITPTLLKGLPAATRKKAEAPANGENAVQAQDNQTAQNQDNANAGNAAAQDQGEVVPSKVAGICIIYRGVVSDFNFEKIGSAPLSITGDINMLSISTERENLTPVYTVGNVKSSDLRALMSKEEIERYDASGELPPDTPEVSPASADNANANSNSNSNSNGNSSNATLNAAAAGNANSGSDGEEG